MAYKQEAELIREDIDLYTFLGLSVFVAYFVSWGTDFYKECRKKSKAKKARKPAEESEDEEEDNTCNIA